MSGLDATVVVTGAGGGIGTAVTEACLAEGASVLATDLPGAGLDALSRLDGVTVVEADVTSRADWERVTDAAESVGAISGLVNNAGIEGAVAPIIEYPEAMFDQVMGVNVKGVFLGLQAVGPLLGDGSAVVNLSSVAGISGTAGIAPYSASKHAVIGLTKSAALEWADRGVRVNAVCPAPIDTRMIAALEDGLKGPDGDRAVARAALEAAIPVGRYGQPSEVADLIVYLLGDRSSFVNGEFIRIDGALKAR